MNISFLKSESMNYLKSLRANPFNELIILKLIWRTLFKISSNTCSDFGYIILLKRKMGNIYKKSNDCNELYLNLNFKNTYFFLYVICPLDFWDSDGFI